MRWRLAILAAGLTAALLATGSGGAAPAQAAQEGPVEEDGRPNVVVVMTDDQTLAQMAALPQVQSLLGDAGLTFSDAVVSYPLCCPSRATFLTGQYTQNHGVRSNVAADDLNPLPEAAIAGAQPEAWPAFRPAEDRTIAVALQQAGYHTAMLGKYLNGYRESAPVPVGWDDWRAATPPGYRDVSLNVNGTQTPVEGYATDAYAGIAGEMIDAAGDSPFFLMVNVRNPHTAGATGITYADRHAELYEGLTAPRGPAFDEADRSDKQRWLRQRWPRLSEEDVEVIDNRWRDAFRSLASVDEAVASIVDHLTAVDELDDTVLVFTSDNGLFYGEHGISGGKYYPYEPAVHVPLIIAGPVVAEELRGTTTDVAVANVDLAPTILDLADAEPLAPVDGRSLVPVLAGDAEDWESLHPRPVQLMGVARRVSRATAPTYSGVRTSDGWMYVKWEDARRSTELYDLDADPDQTQNLVGDPAQAARVARLERQRQRLVRCAGLSCDVPPYGYLDLPTNGSRPMWFRNARWADRRGFRVAYADGTFRPQQPLLRRQALTWLWHRAGAPTDAPPSNVQDVAGVTQDVVDWAVDTGVLPGGTVRFRPKATLVRSEWAAWLWRDAERPEVGLGNLPPDVSRRSRYAPIVAWALHDPPGPVPAVATRVGGRFRLERPLRRAEGVAWLFQATRQRQL